MPTVYQGHYNAFMRTIEPALVPCFRQYNIRFYAYSPLSGSIVDPKNRENANSSGGCFDPKGPYSQHYRSLYWKQGYFDTLDLRTRFLKEMDWTQLTLCFDGSSTTPR